MSRFKGLLGTHKDDKQIKDIKAIKLIESGTISSKVYLIISGTVHIMDKHGIIKYGQLYDGSCFGEISLLLKSPNEYSYFFNERDNKNLFLLEIDSLDFLDICEEYQVSKDIFKERAIKK